MSRKDKKPARIKFKKEEELRPKKRKFVERVKYKRPDYWFSEFGEVYPGTAGDKF